MSGVIRQPIGDEPGLGRLRGRQSGRLSPRAPLRPPRREMVEAAHGLRTSGEVDPHQAQMFDTAPYEISQEELALRQGLPAPVVGTRGGFLPAVKGLAPTKADKAVAASRGVPDEDVARRTRKATVISRWAQKKHGEEVPEAPIAHAYGHLLGLNKATRESHWYMGPGGSQGEAPNLIDSAALATGTSAVAMTRAVALTSPRTAWDEGNVQYRSFPNVESATSVARAVREGQPTTARQAAALGASAPGTALGDRKALAAQVFSGHDPVTDPVPAADPERYQKVTMFNQNLLGGRSDVPRALRRSYAAAHTQDAWDLALQGMPERMHATVHAYDVGAMVAQRAAYKSGRLPMNAQAATWAAHRATVAPETLTASTPDEAVSYYVKRPSLLGEDEQGNLSPQFDFQRYPDTGSRPSRRSKMAEDMGLEF